MYQKSYVLHVLSEENGKHKDNTFTAELVKCFFTVPWAGPISTRDSFLLTLVGLQYPFFTTATGRNTKITVLTDNANMSSFVKLNHIVLFCI